MVVPHHLGVVALKGCAGSREQDGVTVLHYNESFVFYTFPGIDADITVGVELPLIKFPGPHPVTLGNEFKPPAPGILNILEMGIAIEQSRGQMSEGLLKTVDGVVEFFQVLFLLLGFPAVVGCINLPALHRDAFN